MQYRAHPRHTKQSQRPRPTSPIQPHRPTRRKGYKPPQKDIHQNRQTSKRKRYRSPLRKFPTRKYKQPTNYCKYETKERKKLPRRPTIYGTKGTLCLYGTKRRRPKGHNKVPRLPRGTMQQILGALWRRGRLRTLPKVKRLTSIFYVE